MESLSQRSRAVILMARDEAAHLGRKNVGTEHLLFAILRDAGGNAERALAALGVTAALVRNSISLTEPRVRRRMASETRLAQSTVRAIELAAGEALRFQSTSIWPEHLLLGIVREGRSAGAQVLAGLGVDLGTLREATQQRIKAAPLARHADPVPPSRPTVEDLTEVQSSLAATGAVEEILFSSIAHDCSVIRIPPSEPPNTWTLHLMVRTLFFFVLSGRGELRTDTGVAELRPLTLWRLPRRSLVEVAGSDQALVLLCIGTQ
ncbi:MAG: ATP-dependent Clp protease ATP-binding subunit ClpC [Chloroflexota bacterium]|jgi:hypothetical protein|nr:ATP-dependent Clp protease ATP-binding subunit ClpC [Chloroflexota bacterium]